MDKPLKGLPQNIDKAFSEMGKKLSKVGDVIESKMKEAERLLAESQKHPSLTGCVVKEWREGNKLITLIVREVED